MTTLREKVAGVLLRQVQRRIGFDAKYCKSLKEMGNAGNDYYDDADAVLAAMREALLSDEAVEAGAEAIYESAPHLYHVDEIKQFPPFRATDAWVRSSARDSARKQIKAALAALGVQEGGEA